MIHTETETDTRPGAEETGCTQRRRHVPGRRTQDVHRDGDGDGDGDMFRSGGMIHTETEPRGGGMVQHGAPGTRRRGVKHHEGTIPNGTGLDTSGAG